MVSQLGGHHGHGTREAEALRGSIQLRIPPMLPAAGGGVVIGRRIHRAETQPLEPAAHGGARARASGVRVVQAAADDAFIRGK